jgi:hypothetical protein
MLRKISAKFIAIWQLVGAGFISLGVYQLITLDLSQGTPGALFNLTVLTFFVVINLLAGILLLRGSELGRKLSLGNFVAQLLAVNTSWIGFSYISLLQIYVGAFINSPPGTYLAGAGLDFQPGRFWLRLFDEMPGVPQLTINLVAVAFCAVLVKRRKKPSSEATALA